MSWDPVTMREMYDEAMDAYAREEASNRTLGLVDRNPPGCVCTPACEHPWFLRAGMGEGFCCPDCTTGPQEDV